MPPARPLFHVRALPRAAFALAASGIGNAASAQTGDPAAGALLYVQRVNFPVSGLLNCEDCHASGPLFRAFFESRGITESGVLSRLNSAIAANRGDMGVYAGWSAQQRADLAAYIMRGASAPPPPPGAAPPTPTATPNPVLFGSTAVGGSSATIGILFTNASTTTVFFANPALTAVGAQAGDFALVPPPAGTAACPTTGGALVPGMSCSFGVRFAPQAAGSRTAIWNVNFANGVVARPVSLQGTATAAASPAPAPAPAPPPSNAGGEGGGAAVTGWPGLATMLALLAAAGLRRRRPAR